MKHGEHDSKKRIAFPIQLFKEGSAFAEAPDEIHVVPTGKWDHPVYGEMEITTADIAEFVKNFRDKVRLDLRITAGHDNGMSGGELPAIGWFKEIYDRGVNGLYAFVEWTEEGKKLLQDGAFKYFSPEFYEQYSDPETGEKRSHVLVGGALTNMPYFKELDPVVAFSEPGIMNQFKEPMDLKTVLAKKAEDLTADEKAFVREHKAELDADQQSAFASVLEDNNPEPEPTPEPTPEPEPNPEPPVVATEPKGKVITMTYAEVAALKQAAEDGAKALQKIEASEREAHAGKLVFSESNKDGRFLPKQKDALVSFLKTLSEKQRDQFTNLVSNMPKSKLFGEIGDGGSTATSAESIAAGVKTAALAAVKASEGALSYAAAVQKVFAEKPELKERYETALADGSAA